MVGRTRQGRLRDQRALKAEQVATHTHRQCGAPWPSSSLGAIRRVAAGHRVGAGPGRLLASAFGPLLGPLRGLPDETWFPAMEGDRPVAFRPTVARFASDQAAYRLVVNQGRHRLRWLLQRGASEVVLSLSHDSFPSAMDHGLVTRLLNHGDWFRVGFDVGPIYYRPSAAR